MTNQSDVSRITDRNAHLERALIDEFVRAHGHDVAHLDELPDEERRHLLSDAAAYAAMRLAEMEARAHYVHDLHGE